MAISRKDPKGRKLREGENWRNDGRYSYRYTDVRTGKRLTVYAQDLPELREKEKQIAKDMETSVYKGYKRDKIEMRGDRAEMSDFPLYLNTVAGGLDRRDQTIGGFSFVVKIYAVPVVEIIG